MLTWLELNFFSISSFLIPFLTVFLSKIIRTQMLLFSDNFLHYHDVYTKDAASIFIKMITRKSLSVKLIADFLGKVLLFI